MHCDSCHFSVHLKELIKIGEFLCSILILKMEDNMLHFWHIMLYYFKKGKSATKTRKRFAQCIQKVL